MILSEFCSTFGILYFEKSSNTEIEKIEEKNIFQLCIITITKMAAFGTKNVHSSVLNFGNILPQAPV